MMSKPRKRATKKRPGNCKHLRVSATKPFVFTDEDGVCYRAKGRKNMQATQRSDTLPETIPEALTMDDVNQARIMAFAFVEAARLVEAGASFTVFETPEIGKGEEEKVREMMRMAIVAKLKHAGLMVLLNTARKSKASTRRR